MTSPFLSQTEEKERIATALHSAESKRKAALSASLCLSFAVGFIFFQISYFDIAMIGSYLVALTMAGICWQLSGWMWRSAAICSIAPDIAGRYGQTGIRNAWHHTIIEDRLRSLFNAESKKLTCWQSEGNYRNIDYRLREISVHSGSHFSSRFRTPPQYFLVAEISVPVSFSGRIEIRRHYPLGDKIISLIEHVLGEKTRYYTGNQRFDENFAVYAKEISKPEALITPALQQTLLTIAHYELRPRFTGQFEAGWFHLEFPVESVTFSAASLFKPMPLLLDETQSLWWDLTVPQRLIDGLTGNYQGPLH